MVPLLATLAYQVTANAHNGVVVQTTTEWQTPAGEPELFANMQHTPLWFYNQSLYYVWADANARPMVTKITNGKSITVPLDSNPDYTAERDGHNRFAMGIDQKGYIHITGDMHNYSDGTTSAGSKPYPTRYQNQTILYWKSNKPEDVASGFTFAGQKNATTAIPGTGWTYGRFFTDNNGLLYYSSRVKAISGSHLPGEVGLGLYQYNVENQKWTALGALANDTRPGTYYKVLAWENAGMAPDKWYQGFMSSIQFDSLNRMHFAAAMNSDTSLAGNNRIVYAMSSDGGNAWYKANGNKIPFLPIRANESAQNAGDIVAIKQQAPFFDSRTKVMSDKNGIPAVAVDNNTWFIWNGTKWISETKYAPTNTVDLSPTNELILTSNNSSKIAHFASWGSLAQGFDLGNYKSYESVSAYGLRKTGDIYGVAINSDNTQSLLKTVLLSAPLPDEWTAIDISLKPLKFASTDGFLNSTFTLTEYGTALDDVSDSFHLLYQKMAGDGSITARLISTNAPNPKEQAGLMIRETLNTNAKFVFNNINNKRTGAIFTYRNAIDAKPINIWKNKISLPYWIKLERAGNKFVGSISKDGNTWVETGSIAMDFANDIYIGLASTGYQESSMHESKFDNVKVTPVCLRSNPTVQLSPTSQTGPAGGTVDFKIAVTNKDSLTCPVTAFNLGANLPSELTGNLDISSITLKPSEMGATVLHVTSTSSASVKTYPVSIAAINATETTYKATGNSNYIVTAACVLKEPSITIAPATQKTSELKPADYVITLMSNDSAVCDTRLYRFTAYPSTYYLKTLMDPNNVRVEPGKAIQASLVVTPTVGTPAGNYSIKVVTQVGGAGAAALAYTLDEPVIDISADQSNYVRKDTAYDAKIIIKTTLDSEEKPNLPMLAKLTWPDGHTDELNVTTWSDARLLLQTIDKNTPVGTFKVDIIVTYKDKQFTKSFSFSVS
jgi:regulation of enolase protein 1 (concanavalin A-like superfamily)